MVQEGQGALPEVREALVTDEAVVPVTCWLCEEVIPEESPGNVRPTPYGVLKLFCDECVEAVDLYYFLASANVEE